MTRAHLALLLPALAAAPLRAEGPARGLATATPRDEGQAPVSEPLECEACRECDADREEGAACTLVDDVRIRGQLFPAGSRVQFDAAGDPLGVVLAAEHRVGELRFQAWRPLHLHRGGSVAHGWLAGDQEVAGYPARGGTLVVFWEDGRPRRLTLRRPRRIHGVPCAGEVRFHPNGFLAAAPLASAYTYFGHAFPKGWTLRLSPEGRLLELPPCDEVPTAPGC